MTNIVLVERIYKRGVNVEQTAGCKFLEPEICISRNNQTCKLFQRIDLAGAPFRNLR